MGLPADHLAPIWRLEPKEGGTVFAIGLDPREAEFVLERGWATLDGIHYRVSLDGWTGKIEGDGRISVRCMVADELEWRRLEKWKAERDRMMPTQSSSPSVSVMDWWKGFEAS